MVKRAREKSKTEVVKQILIAERINKYFHDPEEFHVIKDNSLVVQENEFVTLVGKSGCGKSTLLYLLATLDNDYHGCIYINGIKVTGMTQNQQARVRNAYIGFVFQFHFLLEEFTVLQNVMMPGLKLGQKNVREIEFDAIQTLRRMDMEKHAGKLAAKLSSGQQQRVAIARALINKPSIIMADEPTGNLDSWNTGLVLEIFCELARQGHAILAVTHDQDFAAKSNRTIEMSDGKLLTGV